MTDDLPRGFPPRKPRVCIKGFYMALCICMLAAIASVFHAPRLVRLEGCRDASLGRAAIVGCMAVDFRFPVSLAEPAAVGTSLPPGSPVR